jgi:hypothetical protein
MYPHFMQYIKHFTILHGIKGLGLPPTPQPPHPPCQSPAATGFRAAAPGGSPIPPGATLLPSRSPVSGRRHPQPAGTGPLRPPPSPSSASVFLLPQPASSGSSAPRPVGPLLPLLRRPRLLDSATAPAAGCYCSMSDGAAGAHAEPPPWCASRPRRPCCQGRPRQIFRRRLLLLRPPPPPSPPRRPCRRLSSPGLTRPRRSASTRPCCAPIRHAHHWGPPSAAPAADAPIRRARHRQWRDASPRSVASHDCAPPAARPPAPLSSSASPWRGHLPPPAATNLRAPPLRLRWRNSDPLLDGSNIPDLTLPGPSSPASHSSAIAPPLPYPLMRYKTIAKLLARCV